jgi:hypothetical protein
MCDHSGTYSGASLYLRDAGQLRLVLLCDECGAECREIGRVAYRPDVRIPGRQPPGIPAGALGTSAAALH